MKNLKIPEDLHKKLKIEAAKQGKTLLALVEELLTKVLKK